MNVTNDPRLFAAMYAINETVGDDPDVKRQTIAAKCRGLLIGYHERWNGTQIEVIDVERFISCDLYNVGTGKPSRTFKLAGKLDVRAVRNGRRLIIDHKTTSDDIEDLNGPYWRQLVIESQPSHYMWLEWMNGTKADEAMWDVVRKPSISPKQVNKTDVTTAIASGYYFGSVISPEDMAELRETGRESLGMYSARLAYDCTEVRPGWYFQRRTVPRLDNELREYAAELWEHSQEIIHARATQRWARNPGACMMYGSPCVYLGICSGHDTPESDNWKRREQVHQELPDLIGDGRDVLTNSRIRCFQTCRRKHLYQYEMGLERIREEEKEALYFGTLWHLALEAWFNASRKENDGDCTIDAAGIEFAGANTAA